MSRIEFDHLVFIKGNELRVLVEAYLDDDYLEFDQNDIVIEVYDKSGNDITVKLEHKYPKEFQRILDRCCIKL